MAFLDQFHRIYTAFEMADVTYHAVVWIGIVEVAPQEGCELIAPDEGAFINFLTPASSDSEFRAKVSRALSAYRLDPLEFQNVRPYQGPTTPLKKFCQSRQSWRTVGIPSTSGTLSSISIHASCNEETRDNC